MIDERKRLIRKNGLGLYFLPYIFSVITVLVNLKDNHKSITKSFIKALNLNFFFYSILQLYKT